MVIFNRLESIAQETLKADQYHEQHRDPYSEEQEDLNLYEKYHQTDMLNVTTYVRPPYDYAATINSLINDIGRMKALCRKTFREYPFKSLDEDVMNKTWVLMWCAPVKHCKALSIDLVSTSMLFIRPSRRRIMSCPPSSLHLSGHLSVRPLTFCVRSITLISFKIFS